MIFLCFIFSLSAICSGVMAGREPQRPCGVVLWSIILQRVDPQRCERERTVDAMGASTLKRRRSGLKAPGFSIR